MNRNDKIFKNLTLLIIIIVFLVFIMALYLIEDEVLFINRVLTGMSIAGFFGMFGQFILALIQEYFKHKNYRICVLCKKSQFSLSLVQGIQDYLVRKPNVQVEIFTFVGDVTSQIEVFLDEEAYNYNGIIIRPIEITENMFNSIMSLLEKKKKIVFLDINLSIEQQKRIKKSDKPNFVCSDFSLGGRMIAGFIDTQIRTYGLENTRVVLFVGPNSKDSFRKRCKSLLLCLAENNFQRITEVIQLDNLDIEDITNKLTEKAILWRSDSFMQVDEKNIIIFCGNDTIAKHIMKQMREGSSMFGKHFETSLNITFIGYDGIVGVDGEYQLEPYGYNYVTVDVLPQNQGKQAAEIIYNMLEYERKRMDNKELVSPKLVTSIKLNKKGVIMIKTNNIKDIDNLLEDKEVFIFDLDGTIADTEKYHWEAYNLILKNYDINLSVDDIKKYIGYTEFVIYGMIKEDFKIDFDNEMFLSNRLNVFLTLVKENNLLPFNYFTEICNQYPNVRYSILSSQKPEIINELLDIWGLKNLFNRIISVYDGKLTKKDVLNDIESHFETKKDRAVLFEDVDRYLKIAQEKEILSIGVQQTYNKNMLENCDAIIIGKND